MIVMRGVLVVVLACAAGFIGGKLAVRGQTAEAAGSVLRSSRFELIDDAGHLVGVWEGRGGRAKLTFLNAKGGPSLLLEESEIGPRMQFLGSDKQYRLLMGLDIESKPAILFGDGVESPRIRLGFNPPDTIPYGGWDQWALNFYRPGRSVPLRFQGILEINGAYQSYSSGEGSGRNEGVQRSV